MISKISTNLSTLTESRLFQSNPPKKRSRPEEPVVHTPKRKKLNPEAPNRLNDENNGQEKTKEPSKRFRVTSHPENNQNQTLPTIEEESETPNRKSGDTKNPDPEIVEVRQLSVQDILKEKISKSKIVKIIEEPTDTGTRIIYELEPNL